MSRSSRECLQAPVAAEIRTDNELAGAEARRYQPAIPFSTLATFKPISGTP